MKRLGFAATFWLGSWALAWGQVNVGLTLEYDKYLAKEPLVAAVRVTNFSGQTLRLGGAADWLQFSIEAHDGAIPSKLADPPVVGEFEVPPSSTATRRVDLAPYFDLSQPGRYSVTAVVRVPDWNLEVSTGPARFDIVSGSTLWEQKFGLPASSTDAQGPPEVRTYSLIQMNRMKRMTLYGRVADASGAAIFRVVALGPLISFSRPEAQIDRDSNLHVLFQTGARRFRYCVLNPQGFWVRRETHDYTWSRPTLTAAEDGSIRVTGGVRRISDDDLPPSKALERPESAAPAKP